MNTIEGYAGPRRCPQGMEFSKDNLQEKVQMLLEITQSIIDRMAKNEGVQLGPITIGHPDGPRFVLYENALVECNDCKAKIPAEFTKYGMEFYRNEKRELICYECHIKKPEPKKE